MMNTATNTTPHIVVVVLGDVGRSPRMQYHTRSLLEQGYYVSLVGYDGEDLIPDLQQQQHQQQNQQHQHETIHPQRLNVVRFTPYCPPTWLKQYKLKGKIPIGLPIYLIIRLFGLLFGLIYALWFRVPVRKSSSSDAASSTVTTTTMMMPPVQCILVQNPPSIPLLLISYIYCITHSRMVKIQTSTPTITTITPTTKSTSQTEQKKYHILRPGLIIDWHNLGYTMFDTPSNHPITKVAKLYEQFLAPLADGNLCVTNAMKDYLIQEFYICNKKLKVLYDRPPEFFHCTSLEKKHDLMMKLQSEMEGSCPMLKEMRLRLECYKNESDDVEECTLFTKSIVQNDGTKVIHPQDNQPILLISSTSWTPDEDFSILLDALVALDSNIVPKIKDGDSSSNSNSTTVPKNHPHFIVIVTGKGPQKEMYRAKINQLNLTHVSIITMWLEAEDYPILLGCADMGISLHLSTSNLDLPMKIYDFFGCEVPVCAVGFPCLDELVKDDENGRIFTSSTELSSQLYNLCCGKERDEKDDYKLVGDLSRYRKNIRDISRWRENWVLNAHEIIKEYFPSVSGAAEASAPTTAANSDSDNLKSKTE